MSRLSLKALQAAAGSGGEKVYVDDLFATYLYGGNNGTYPEEHNYFPLPGMGGQTQGNLIHVKRSGTKLYGYDQTAIVLYSYDFAEAYNNRSVTNRQTKALSGRIMGLNETATEGTISLSTGLQRFTMTDGDISTLTLQGSPETLSLSDLQSEAGGLVGSGGTTAEVRSISPNGQYMYVTSRINHGGVWYRDLVIYTLSTPFDVSTRSYWKQINAVFSQGVYSWVVNKDGTEIVENFAQSRFRMYTDMTTAYDPSTAATITDAILSAGIGGSAMRNFSFSADPDIYFVGYSGNFARYRRISGTTDNWGGSNFFVKDNFRTGINLADNDGMVITKSRDYDYEAAVYDTKRGVQKGLQLSETSAETTRTDGLSSFDENGFTHGGHAFGNQSSYDYFSYTFRTHPGFFDIVTYTGDGTSNRAIAHGLDSVPGWILVRRRGSAGSFWMSYHQDEGANRYANGTGGYTTYNQSFPSVATSTNFYVGNWEYVNQSGSEYVAYLFADNDQRFGEDEDEEIIRTSEFTTDASGNVTVDLGWRPQMVWLQQQWRVYDDKRGMMGEGAGTTASGNSPRSYLNIQNIESTTATEFEVTPSGFKLTAQTANTTYKYLAIRSTMKPASERSLANLEALQIHVYQGSNNNNGIVEWNDFSHRDIHLLKRLSSGDGWYSGHNWWYPKNIGRFTMAGNSSTTKVVVADLTNESLDYGVWGSDDGRAIRITWSASYADVSRIDSVLVEGLAKMPGVYDQVVYAGTGSIFQSGGIDIPHNLRAVPEMIFIKRAVGGTGDWFVYHKDMGIDKHLKINSNAGEAVSDIHGTAPTETDFYIDDAGEAYMANSSYLAMLFASSDGVSSVGSYTGNGSATGPTVNCGFIPRLIWIKSRSTGNWVHFNGIRGISVGNDKFTYLNSTSTEVTADYLDPTSSGFQIKTTAQDVNTNGQSYIYFALA